MQANFQSLSDSKIPVRILHIVGSMNRGGLETWLMQVLRIIDRQKFQIDILTHTQEPGQYDAEVLSLGSRILTFSKKPHPLRYEAEFKCLLQKYGPYSVIHSHVHFLSGFILKLAKESHIPCRIAHSHINLSTVERQSNWFRKTYFSLMRYWIQRFATHGFATSASAALNLFGHSWNNDRRIQILLSAVDLQKFEQARSSITLRRLWKIPTEAFVIGHIGRFDFQKNHRFIIEVASELIRQNPCTILMLVGEGPLRLDIEQYVRKHNLVENVIFTGSRPDIPEILLGVLDAFIFPSHFEGLGMALVEAQAAGLPCIISDIIPQEAEVFPDLVKRLSLEKSPIHWANMLIEHVKKTPKKSIKATLPALRNSPLNMRNSISAVTSIYTESTHQSLVKSN